VQGQHLTAAHPVGQGQHDRRLEPVSIRSLQELPRLVDGERPAILGPDARRGGQAAALAVRIARWLRDEEAT
jgi:hypothetical protein